MTKNKRAIVTGCTGVIGSALVKLLCDRKIQTYVVCHLESQRNDTISDSEYIHKIYCNLNELKQLPEMIDTHLDAFFHLAWSGNQDRTNRMDMYLQNDNVRYALDSVQAAQTLGCKVYIGAGSQAEYGYVDGIIHSDQRENPVTGYGMAKLCAEQMTRAMCKEAGIRHIWPRIVSVYGPNDGKDTLISTIIRELMNNETPKLTAGEQMWDYLYSQDAAEALLAMAESGHDGAKYVLGSGHVRPLKEYMELTRDAVDKSAKLDIGAIPYLPNQVMHLEADISDLTRDTGWKPRTSFEDGIQKTVEYEANKKQ